MLKDVELGEEAVLGKFFTKYVLVFDITDKTGEIKLSDEAEESE